MDTTTINGVEIIRGLDIEEYHRSPILSHTKLQDWITGSPAAWKAKWVEGNRSDKESDHFVVGRALDDLIFDRAGFAQRWTTSPARYPSLRVLTKKEVDAGTAVASDEEVESCLAYMGDPDGFRGKPCGIEFKTWNAQARYCDGWIQAQAREGRSILTSDQMRMVKAEASEVARNPFAREILRAPGAEFQVTLRWEIDGILFQARPDIVNFQDWTWDDLKTARNLEAIGKHFVFLGYDMQAGLIWDALTRLRGEEPARSRHIYVDKGFYPACEVREIFGPVVGPAYMEYGFARAVRIGKEIEQARRTGKFERPQKEMLPMVVPEWIQRKIVERDEVSPGEFAEDVDEVALEF